MSGTEDSACVLVPGDVQLGTTGAEVAGWVVGAGALVAVGVVALLIALVLRARRQERSGAGFVAAALVLLSIVGLGQTSPSTASAATEGCDLIGWSMLTSSQTGVEVVLGDEPIEVVSFMLKNVSNMPIEVRLRTDTKADPDGLATFVQVSADCSTCANAIVYSDVMGALEPGTAFTLAGGASVDVRFSATLLPGLGDEAQNKTATFGITALARQI